MNKYNLYTKSVAPVDAAHETGVMHGIRLNDSVDYNQPTLLYDCPVFGDEDDDVQAGPSMLTLYDNLGRIVQGEVVGLC